MAFLECFGFLLHFARLLFAYDPIYRSRLSSFSVPTDYLRVIIEALKRQLIVHALQ